MPTDTTIKKDYSADIQRLTLVYLTTAKEALDRNGRDFVESTFGMTDPLLSWIEGASAEQLHKLAQSQELRFSFQLPVGTRN